MNCSHNNCPRELFFKGYCRMHYQRNRSGLAMDAPPRVTSAGKWTKEEDRLLKRVYVSGGVAAVKAATGRSSSSIVNRAYRLGVLAGKEEPVCRLPLTPVPRMDLMESLACVRFAKWKGPATPGLVGARLAA